MAKILILTRDGRSWVPQPVGMAVTTTSGKGAITWIAETVESDCVYLGVNDNVWLKISPGHKLRLGAIADRERLTLRPSGKHPGWSYLQTDDGYFVVSCAGHDLYLTQEKISESLFLLVEVPTEKTSDPNAAPAPATPIDIEDPRLRHLESVQTQMRQDIDRLYTLLAGVVTVQDKT